jgi:hypothetical protein
MTSVAQICWLVYIAGLPNPPGQCAHCCAALGMQHAGHAFLMVHITNSDGSCAGSQAALQQLPAAGGGRSQQRLPAHGGSQQQRQQRRQQARQQGARRARQGAARPQRCAPACRRCCARRASCAPVPPPLLLLLNAVQERWQVARRAQLRGAPGACRPRQPPAPRAHVAGPSIRRRTRSGAGSGRPGAGSGRAAHLHLGPGHRVLEAEHAVGGDPERGRQPHQLHGAQPHRIHRLRRRAGRRAGSGRVGRRSGAPSQAPQPALQARPRGGVRCARTCRRQAASR